MSTEADDEENEGVENADKLEKRLSDCWWTRQHLKRPVEASVPRPWLASPRATHTARSVLMMMRLLVRGTLFWSTQLPRSPILLELSGTIITAHCSSESRSRRKKERLSSSLDAVEVMWQSR